MKQFKIVILAVTLITTAITTSNAQKLSSDKVPAAVTSAFKSRFPAVTKVSWEMEDAKEYEANFKQNGEEASASFDLKGVWMETEMEMENSDLPASIKTTLDKEFAGYKLKELNKVENVKDGHVYEAVIEKGEENWEVVFTAAGKVVNKTKMEEGKDKD
ncbi:MAG: PepSY-like domain-containing protein [Saprospiraceae bacterium]